MEISFVSWLMFVSAASPIVLGERHISIFTTRKVVATFGGGVLEP